MLFKVGDLVILQETVEWDTLVGIKGELCIVAEIYEETNEGIFFDYRIVLGDGASMDVWQGEIKRVQEDGS